LKPGAVTIGLSNLLSLAGIQFSFEASCAWLKEFLLFEVSENTVRQETERMGELMTKMEAAWIAQSQREDWLQMRQGQNEPVAETLYCAIDAAKVRTEPRAKAGQPKEPHEDWRDVKCLVWFEAEEVPLALQTGRDRSKTARQEVPRRAVRKEYACAITDTTQFGELLWATGCQRQTDRSFWAMARPGFGTWCKPISRSVVASLKAAANKSLPNGSSCQVHNGWWMALSIPLRRALPG
jgi:hypothetical protein